MRYIIILMMLLSSVLSVPGHAQMQEAQQLLMDIEKLAQLKAMLSSMYNGYQTLSEGYNSISQLAKGNFDLHNSYLVGLLGVNPVVRTYGKVEDIRSDQLALARDYKAGLNKLRLSGLFSGDELIEVKMAMDAIVTRCSQYLDQLNLVLSPGSLRMNDAERISAIDQIATGVTEQRRLLDAVIKEKERMLDRREQNRRDIRTLRGLYGIKQKQ